MNCEQCGTELLEGAKFCSSCGAAVPSMEPPRKSGQPVGSRGPRRRGVVLSLAIVAVAALVVLGVLLIRPFGGDGGGPDESEATAPGANMYRGNPARTGEYPGPGPKGSPTLLWRFNTRGYPSGSVVADGVVYVATGGDAATDARGVYALDAPTGDLLWHFRNDRFYWSSPAALDGVLYVTATDSGEDDTWALDACSGKVLWRVGMEASAVEPVVADGLVYVGGVLVDEQGAQQHSGDYLYALNASTGSVVWRFDLASNFNKPPAVAGGVVYVPADDAVYALDAHTGGTLWVRGEEGRCVAAVGPVVYVAGADGLHALDVETGDMLWQFETDRCPAVVDGVVYVGGDDYAHALDADTGAVLWRSQLASLEQYGLQGGSVDTISVADGVLYFKCHDERICAMDAVTGENLWSFRTDGEIEDENLAVVGGVIYVGTEEGYVDAIGGSQGE